MATVRPPLVPPAGARRVLLHSCCAPCAGELMEAMHGAGLDFLVYFYNPNIHPREEYELRKAENVRFARKLGVSFVDADYEVEVWGERTAGLEREPERGARCTVCFDLRLERAAQHAHAHGFPVFATSLGISRCKNLGQVQACGRRAAALYPGLAFWEYNWRKNGGSCHMAEICNREAFHRQQYCGCVHSLRDANRWRLASGREAIVPGRPTTAGGAAEPRAKSDRAPAGERP